jgi:very-short-patch-repair endonuclease
MRGAKKVKTNLARKLRRNSTSAELRLWNRLRSRSIDGRKFVRQEPLGPYVVDFICREARLVIEVDGGQHADSVADRVRERWLQDHNYRVLRFWNNDVMRNIEGVLEVIAASVAEAAPPHPASTLARESRPLPASGER